MMMGKRIVLVGGGHSHVQTLRDLKNACLSKRVSLTVVDKNEYAMYSGMMPATIAGLYKEQEAMIHIPPLAAWAGADFLQDEVVEIDDGEKWIKTRKGKKIDYDLLSIDIGSTTRGLQDVAGVQEYAIATRPINRLIGRLEKKEQELVEEHGIDDAKPVPAVVVGGGAAGCELAMGLAARWKMLYPKINFSLTLVHNAGRVMPYEKEVVAQEVRKQLDLRDIQIVDEAVVERVEERAVLLRDGRSIEARVVVWATGAESHLLQRREEGKSGTSTLGASMAVRGVKLDDNGYVLVDSNLRSVSSPTVFGGGDCISLRGSSVPKAGVFAVREGPILGRNLLASVEEEELIKYEPQGDFLKLLMCGDGTGIGTKFGIAFSGKWVWKLKDHIDRTFMRLFDPERLRAEMEEDSKDGGSKPKQYDAGLAGDTAEGLEAEEAAEMLLVGTRKPKEDTGDFSTQHSILTRMAKDQAFAYAVCKRVHQLCGQVN